MYKVSIIIPTYNHASYILEAVQSALEQDYPYKEVIVVDDGSTDNTRELLAPFIDAGQIRYQFQPNAGLSAARNTGIKLSDGVLLKFLDSDDLIYQGQLSAQAEDMRLHEAGLVYSDYETLYYSEVKKTVITAEGKDLSRLAYFMKHNPAPVHAYLVKKDLVVEAGGFDESLKAMEDWDLWLRLIWKGTKVFKAEGVGCVYRIFKDSMSSDEEKMFLQRCRVFEKLNTFWVKDGARLSDQEKKLLLELNLELAYRCMARGLRVRQLLPETYRTTQLFFECSEKKVFVKRLTKIFGLSLFLKASLARKYFFDRPYISRITQSENSWRERAMGKTFASPTYNRRWSHEHAKENQDTLH